ncbi:MAG: SDR family NAD(P)-dependent oxidoreductase [Rhodobacteraceae bacterium]|nr:SDR family NAD(P)-dependent oxidoreductase [Paracoccaceae bacterium]
MSIDLALKDRVALITGGSRGLGAATARLLAAEGAKLVLAARSAGDLAKLADDLHAAYGTQSEAIPVDLTDPQSAEAAAAKAREAFGRIDILVNSAGASQGGLFWEIPDKVWDESFDLKVMGTVRMMRAVIPGMIAQKYGRIVNIVGNTGLQPSPRLLPGSAANAALLAITRGLGEELAPHNVIVNAINPGPTRTERWTTLMNRLAQGSRRTIAEVEGDYTAQIPRGELAQPEEIANWIVFLCSDRAANMVGGSITADGGWSKGIG